MANGLKLTTAISKDTFQRFVLDAGIVYQDHGETSERILGVTSGGSVFTVEPEFRKMDVDGAPGDVEGDKRIVGVSVKLSTNLMEFTDDNISLALPGAEAVTQGNGKIFTRNCQINDGHYSKNITLVMKKAGTEELFALQIKKALHLGSFELTGAEDTEALIPLELTGHFDKESMDVEPWSIFNPSEVPVVTHVLTYIAGANGGIIGDTSQTVNDGADGEFVQANPDALYQFIAWDDASTDNPRKDLAVADDITVTANFTLI